MHQYSMKYNIDHVEGSFPIVFYFPELFYLKKKTFKIAANWTVAEVCRMILSKLKVKEDRDCELRTRNEILLDRKQKMSFYGLGTVFKHWNLKFTILEISSRHIKEKFIKLIILLSRVVKYQKKVERKQSIVESLIDFVQKQKMEEAIFQEIQVSTRDEIAHDILVKSENNIKNVYNLFELMCHSELLVVRDRLDQVLHGKSPLINSITEFTKEINNQKMNLKPIIIKKTAKEANIFDEMLLLKFKEANQEESEFI